MKASVLAWMCSGLPIGVVALCTMISMGTGAVEACNPFWTGCVSVSAVARQEPAVHLFRLVMLPTGTLMAGFWWMTRAWLIRRGTGRATANALAGLGGTGVVFLMLYVVFLGTGGGIYAWLRRFGTTTFFGCTGVAQLWLTARLSAGMPEVPRGIRVGMLAIGVGMLAIGIVYLPVSELLEAPRLQNRLEWGFALLMQLYFGGVARLWSREGLRVELTGSSG